VGTLFAPLVAAEGMVPKDVMCMMAAGARRVVWVDRESEFAADAEKRKDSGVRRFLRGLLDMAMRGYDVAGDRMLGRRWK
jgi:hypothetical protein